MTPYPPTLRSQMDEVPEPEEIDEFFETYDEDKDGKVGFQEIVEVDARNVRETDYAGDAEAEA